MLHLAPGIFGCRARAIIKALISACRTKRNAGPGRRALLLTVLTHQAHIVPILTVLILLILPAPTKWFLCSAQAAISCITILPTPRFTATAK